MVMFEKLETVEKRYDELTKMISDPEVISNHTAKINERTCEYRRNSTKI